MVFENEDVFGDGVNIASRIQAIAEPGGIYISASIENAIRNRSDIKIQYLGEADLKNVDYPVKVFAIQGEGFPVPAFITKSSQTKKNKSHFIVGHFYRSRGSQHGLLSRKIQKNDAASIQSLAVLPIVNLTGSEETEIHPGRRS